MSWNRFVRILITSKLGFVAGEARAIAHASRHTYKSKRARPKT